MALLRTELMQQFVIVTPEDYILGMSDLTGELMRYATNGTPSSGIADRESKMPSRADPQR